MTTNYNEPWNNEHEIWHKKPFPFKSGRDMVVAPETLKKLPETVTIASLFPNLDRFAIGWDAILEDLKRASASTRSSSYPPYDVTKLDGGIFIISLAVAGFSRDELEVITEGNALTISGAHDADVEPEGEVIHAGIAKRDFTLNFRLADGVYLESARLEDGILTIHMKKDIPEAEKPKKIEIK